MIGAKPVEQDDLVEAVEEFGPEMAPHDFHHFWFDLFYILTILQRSEMLAAQIGREDDERVRKVHRAALTIGQAAIVEYLKQNVEDVGMRFFDLVEQHHLIGPTPDSLGQDTAFFISDIARRCTDQPRYAVLFHEFGHINADHRIVVIEQK